MSVEAILKSKGHKVATIRPEANVTTAVKRLRMENIGALVVSEDAEAVLGIISERDVIQGLAKEGAGLLERHVNEVMTSTVHTCKPADSVKTVMAEMTRHRVRHLPVVEGDRLCGIVSIGDVVKRRLDDLELESSTMRDAYIAVR